MFHNAAKAILLVLALFFAVAPSYAAGKGRQYSREEIRDAILRYATDPYLREHAIVAASVARTESGGYTNIIAAGSPDHIGLFQMGEDERTAGGNTLTYSQFLEASLDYQAQVWVKWFEDWMRNSKLGQKIIGMAVFVKDGGQWRLEVEDRFAAYTGFSETMKLQKVGANKYGVLLTDVSHYGAGCDDVEVKLLMPQAGGVTAHELNVPLTEKEEMSFSECKATSVSFDTKSRDEHYPVTVKQTFTDERGRNIKKSARLTFSNGSYVKSK